MRFYLLSFENWKDLTAIEQDQLTSINNFFCGLHYVVGLADVAEEVFKKWENQTFSTELSGPSKYTNTYSHCMQSIPPQGITAMWKFHNVPHLPEKTRNY